MVLNVQQISERYECVKITVRLDNGGEVALVNESRPYRNIVLMRKLSDAVYHLVNDLPPNFAFPLDLDQADRPASLHQQIDLNAVLANP